MFFSIIVPVYNGQQFLEKCVDSVLQQTFTDFELILVNDGSTDQSPQLCEKYASRDKRVKVIHQTNSGQTKARQAGLMESQGEYVVYVDADDWVGENMLERSRQLIQVHGVDLISYAFSHVSAEASDSVAEPVPEGIYDKPAMETSIYPCLLLGSNMKNMFYTITGKVIRHDLLYEKQMAVNENLKLGEDAACTVGVYLGADKVYISDEIMYFYRVHQQSSSHQFRIGQYDQIADTIRYFEGLNIPVDDFDKQIDRYVMLVSFCLLLSAVGAHGYRELSNIRLQMNRPVFREHILRAQFDEITLKTRITYLFIKKNCIRAAYWFLAFCRVIKKG